MSPQRVFIAGGSPASRRSAQRLAAAAGLEIVESAPLAGGASPLAALFHLPASSAASREARRLVQDLAPTPVIALSAACGNGTCAGLRRLGLAGCVPLSADEAETARSLSATLARIAEGGSGRCPHCPLGLHDGDTVACSLLPQDQGQHEWTGHDSRGELCFPFVAVSPAMLEVQRQARRVADSDATVFLTGESGTGKEVLARYIHRQGSRSRGPFVKVNCAALPDHLLESEIFGHEKGAFTDAGSRKLGRFERAEGGIIFLDEISEMSLGLQAKLLQVLEAKSFHRLGGLDEIEVDVQIVAATNRGIEEEVSAGRFRDDLYYRLRVIELHLPPLRERREDIPRLVDYFLCRLSRHYSRALPTVSPSLLEALCSAPWAGNVRELENALRRLVILGEERQLVEELARGNGTSVAPAPGPAAPEADVPSPHAHLNLKEIARAAAQKAERDAILAALSETRWNRSRAARLLGVSYKTLLSKMKDLLPREA